MRASGFSHLISAAIAMLSCDASATSPTRTYEGVWYVMDSTDNNTGAREVEAFQSYIKPANYVTLRMRCSNGKPTMFVEWADVEFPDQVVLTIGPRRDLASATNDQQYVFAKSDDPVESGLRAAPETSSAIVSAMTGAKYALVVAHLSSGRRAVDMDVDGTAGAWSRVSRHCPIRTSQPPPP